MVADECPRARILDSFVVEHRFIKLRVPRWRATQSELRRPSLDKVQALVLTSALGYKRHPQYCCRRSPTTCRQYRQLSAATPPRTRCGRPTGPRFLIARMYYKYYQSVLYHWIHFLAAIACWLNVAENLALVGLTFISSSENYSVHEKCFMMFMVTSELYMMLTCYLLRSMRCQPPDNVETRSLRIKYQLLVVNVISFALAAYCFLRHNWYCEPGVYSLFSLCEYVVVLTNMGFHMTASWDFHGRELLVWLPGFQPQEKAPRFDPRRVPPLASDETLSFPCLPLVDPSPLGVMARHSVESIVRQIPAGPAECRCPLWPCGASRDTLPTYQQYVYMMVDHRAHRCEGLVTLGHVTNLPAVCVYDGESQGTQV
uniref:CWH43-like N-terminal domain-containing protein n=1 Tax=Timema poppense TaxID=170557 RepID=A0A7R9DA78_TIMPO|nr:unnamed protein product [Timema poppensis]